MANELRHASESIGNGGDVIGVGGDAELVFLDQFARVAEEDAEDGLAGLDVTPQSREGNPALRLRRHPRGGARRVEPLPRAGGHRRDGRTEGELLHGALPCVHPAEQHRGRGRALPRGGRQGEGVCGGERPGEGELGPARRARLLPE